MDEEERSSPNEEESNTNNHGNGAASSRPRQQMREVISRGNSQGSPSHQGRVHDTMMRAMRRSGSRQDNVNRSILTGRDMAGFDRATTPRASSVSSLAAKSPRSSTPGSASPSLNPSRKRNKKKTKTNNSLHSPEQFPSASFADQPTVFVDDEEEDALEMFDIDCSPYNDERRPINETDDAKGQPNAPYYGPRSHSSGQSSRSRRTVSPFPYKTKSSLKKRDSNEWGFTNSKQGLSWPDDDDSFIENTYNVHAATTFDDESNTWEMGRFQANENEEPMARGSWHDEPEDGGTGNSALIERYRVDDEIDSRSENRSLKPCLKKNGPDHQRRSRNVSWEDENNVFDTAVDGDEDGDADELSDVEDDADSVALQAHSDPSLDSVDGTQSRAIKTPANSMEETTDMLTLEEREGVGSGFGGTDSPIMAMTDAEHSPRRASTGQNGAINTAEDHGQPEFAVKDNSRRQISSWMLSDDAISRLTDEEKQRLAFECETRTGTMATTRPYDDPYLPRADRIRLLWEDCARKEILLEKLRPRKADGPESNLARYSHYLY